jgi:hypothetical protein
VWNGLVRVRRSPRPVARIGGWRCTVGLARDRGNETDRDRSPPVVRAENAGRDLKLRLDPPARMIARAETAKEGERSMPMRQITGSERT